MADGGKIIAKVHLSCKDSFSKGVANPYEIKKFADCKKMFCVIIVINY